MDTCRRRPSGFSPDFDVDEGLLRAEGPLFIDVFRRSEYTLDTNTVAIYLLERMAETAEVLGDSKAATRYRDFAARLKAGVYRRLWNGTDHFLTQRNTDGTTRDFVDYDGNFAALAFGVLDSRAEEEMLLRRLDSGPHTHPGGRGTGYQRSVTKWPTVTAATMETPTRRWPVSGGWICSRAYG